MHENRAAVTRAKFARLSIETLDPEEPDSGAFIGYHFINRANTSAQAHSDSQPLPESS